MEHVRGRGVFICPELEADTQALRVLRRELAGENNYFEVTITKDPRSGDLAVYRHEDVPKPLDFSFAKEEPMVHFAHKSGFLATVENLVTARRLIATADIRNEDFKAQTIDGRIQSLKRMRNKAEEIGEEIRRLERL